MRTLKIFAHISLDGIISPGGVREDSNSARGDWTAPYRSAAGAAAVAEATGRDFDLLLGRRTYDLWASFWPSVTTGPFADSLNAARKYVATHRPESLAWGPVEGLGADVVASVRRILSRQDRDLIMWGSTTLTPVLFAAGLVDEVVLIVYPILLGQGTRFFPDFADSRQLTLISTKSTSTGVLINVYRDVGVDV